MKKVFILSKQNLKLSKAELTAQLANAKTEQFGNIVIADTIRDLSNLAYTKQINQFLFKTSSSELLKKISMFNWKKIYSKSFAVRFEGRSDLEPKLGSLIYKNLGDPMVDLENPDTLIEFHKFRSTVICSLFISRIDSSIEQRKPHLRPHLVPVSSHPRLSRCLINLTGIRRGKILDPFCGTGGILIEAGLMGLHPVGYDVLKKMINISRLNLKHYNIMPFTLKQTDCTSETKKFKYVAAELPYMINTKKQDLRLLYDSFFKNLRLILGRRAALSFPNKIPRRIISKHNLKVTDTFSVYIHKGLTKKIVVLEPGR